MKNTNNETNVSGMLGEEVSVRKVSGRVVVKNRKRKTPTVTPKLEMVQDRFQEASQYAKGELAKPESRQLYSAGITDKKRSAYAVAMSDYLVIPKVKSIDTGDYTGTIGDPIIIGAKDDFMVTKVKVLIMNSSGAVIEQGYAEGTPAVTGFWTYKTTVANLTLTGTIIRAIAYDRAGNKGVREVTL